VYVPLPASLPLQRRRVGVQVVDQYERDRDVRRQRHVVVDGHLPQLVQRQRPLLPVRRAELLHAVRVVDLRRFPAQPRQGFRSTSRQIVLFLVRYFCFLLFSSNFWLFIVCCLFHC